MDLQYDAAGGSDLPEVQPGGQLVRVATAAAAARDGGGGGERLHLRYQLRRQRHIIEEGLVQYQAAAARYALRQQLEQQAPG